MAHRLSRRSFLSSAVLAGSGLLGAYLVGCGKGPDESGRLSPTATPPAAPPPAGTPTATTAPATLRWRQLQPGSDSPPPRRDHSLVSDGQRLFLFGGRAGEPLADLWSYDGVGATWTEVVAAGAPPARFGHNAIWDVPRGRLVVFGGQAGGTFFNDVWAFDPASGQWSQLSPAGASPSARYGAGAALDPAGRLLVTHGFTTAGRFDDTWALALDSDSWTDLATQRPRPVERCLMRAAWDAGAGQLLMFGGQTTGTPFLGDLWALGDGAWREIAAQPKPSPRNFYAMAFDEEGRRLILFGGNTADGPLNDLWFFDTTTERWSQPSPQGEGPPPARAGHDAAWLPGSHRLIVFGGQTTEGDSNELWELNVPL